MALHDKRWGCMYMYVYVYSDHFPSFIKLPDSFRTLSNPNHLSKTPPLNTLLRLRFHLLNTSQWGFNFNT